MLQARLICSLCRPRGTCRKRRPTLDSLSALCLPTILLFILFALLGEKLPSVAAKQRQWHGVDRIRGRHEGFKGIQATAELHGKIYAVVGYFVNHLNVFDPATLTWEDISGSVSGAPDTRTEALRAFSLTAESGFLYFFGGIDASLVPSNKMFVWDPTTLAWSQSPEIGAVPKPRQDPGFAGAEGVLYVLGGFSQDAGFLNDLHAFDTATQRWRELPAVSGSPPAPCHNMGFAVGPGPNGDGQWLYVFGGFSEAGVVNSGLRAFDTGRSAWVDLSSAAGSAPAPRHAMGFTFARGLLYVFGGAATGAVYEDLRAFDPRAAAWSEVRAEGPAPPAQSGAALHATGGGKLIVLGGASLAGEANGEMHMLDADARAWFELSRGIEAKPEGRSAMGMTEGAGKLFVFGGYDFIQGARVAYDDLWIFEPLSMRWEAALATSNTSLPAPRWNTALTYSEPANRLYLFSGRHNTLGWLFDMWELDLAAMRWTELHDANMPLASSSPAMGAVGPLLYLYVSMVSSGGVNELHSFDTRTRQWQDLSAAVQGTPPSPRSGFGLAAVGDLLFIYGGFSPLGLLSEVHRLDTRSLTWEELSPTAGAVPPNRYLTCFAAAAGRLYVFGGYTIREVFDDDFWVFDVEQREWTELTFQVGGEAPAMRYYGGMAAVGEQLLVFGGNVPTGMRDGYPGQSVSGVNAIIPVRDVAWPATLADWAFVYDWDVVRLEQERPNRLAAELDLCVGLLPCSLRLRGDGATLAFGAQGRLACDTQNRCEQLHIASTHMVCEGPRPMERSMVSALSTLVSVADSSVAGCRSLADGALLFADSGASVSLARSSFSDMYSAAAGGVLSALDAVLSIDACTFTRCGAAGFGGAIVTSSSLHITDSTFSNCSSGQDGGGIFSFDGAAVSVSGSRFEHSRSAASGGALSVMGRLEVWASEFVGCESAGAGGAIRARESNDFFRPLPAAVTLANCSLEGCAAGEAGGAVSISGGALTVFNSYLVGGQAGTVGGAVSCEDGSMELELAWLVANEARGLGGGALYTARCNASLSRVSALANTAPAGGGGVVLWEGSEQPEMRGWQGGLCGAGPERYQCPPGSTGPGRFDCVECEPGTFKAGTGAGACEACPEQSSSAGAAVARESCRCLPGFTGPDGGPCVPCPAGTYKADSGSAACESCPAGAYSSLAGRASCSPCPADTFHDGSAAEAACVACPEGTGSRPQSFSADNCSYATLLAGLAEEQGACSGQCSCGFFTEAEGTLSDGSGPAVYDSFSTCWWIIAPPQAVGVSLAFSLFETEERYDWVLVYECESMACEDPKELVVWSGSRPAGDVVTTQTGFMKVAMTSDRAVQLQGFEAAWTAVTHCEPGTESVGGRCRECEPAKPPNSVYPREGCAWECEAGFYASEGRCVACAAPMSSAAGSESAAACNLCERGFTGPDGGPCVPCEAGTYKDAAGSGACSACGLSGTFQERSGQSSCSSCEAGSYHNGTAVEATCASCPAQSVSPQGSHLLSNCSCSPGYTGPDGGPCVACAPGKYKAETGRMACSDCSAGSYQESGGMSECVPCPANTYHDGTAEVGSCAACPEGSGSYPQSSSLEQCSAAKLLEDLAQQWTCRGLCSCAYLLEAEGTLSDGSGASNYYSSSDCWWIIAPAGAVSVSVTLSSLKTEQGYDLLKIYECESVDCAASVELASMSGSRQGETARANTGFMMLKFRSDLSQNDAGFQAAWTSSTACPSGFSHEGSTCLPCSVLPPANATYLPDRCAWECEAGFYASEGRCVACAAPMSSAAGSESAAACNLCERGFTGPDGGPCVPCEAGTYKDATGSGECSACWSGTFQARSGQSSCSSCEAGSYHSGTAVEATCASCPAQSVSPQGSHLLSNCSCPPGYTGPEGGACVACAPGKYKAETGRMACSECSAGSYATEGGSLECLDCPAGTYPGSDPSQPCAACPEQSSSAGAAVARESCRCLPGFTGPDGGPCVPCPAGTYKADSGSAACESCPAGAYSSLAGRASCSPCPADTFHDGSAAEAACVACPEGTGSRPQSFSADNCSYATLLAGLAEEQGACSGQCSCGFFTEAEGTLSDGSGAGLYGAQTTCWWIIAPPQAVEVSLTFPFFETEALEDWVLVYECESIACEDAELVAELSGSISAGDVVTTQTGFMKVEFKTDARLHLRGFEAAWTSGTHCEPGTESVGGRCRECESPPNSVYPREGCAWECEAGFYASEGRCVACAAPMSSAAGSESAAACNLCERGFTGPDGGPCVPCEAGTYKDAAGSGACSACPEHAESAPGSTALAYCMCEEGYTGSAAGGCRECEGGAGAECNAALFGGCVASSFWELAVETPATAFAGENFEFSAVKRDYYGHRIASDSASILQVLTSTADALEDKSLDIVGSQFGSMLGGQARFVLAVKPTVTAWDAATGQVQLLRVPLLQVRGADSEAERGHMQSAPTAVRVSSGAWAPVCEAGAVLRLEAAALGQQGFCERCPPGTYSLLPLVGTPASPAVPSCLRCPAGGVCEGGSEVTFAVGSWEAVGGRWVLRGCPDGKALVAERDGVWEHDVQECRDCEASQYKLQGAAACQDCPKGAVCDGLRLTTKDDLDATGEVEWAPDAEGRLWLQRCPSGYRLENATGYALQECQRCAANMFIVSSASPAFFCQPCPRGFVCIDGGPPVDGAVVQAQLRLQWPDPAQAAGEGGGGGGGAALAGPALEALVKAAVRGVIGADARVGVEIECGAGTASACALRRAGGAGLVASLQLFSSTVRAGELGALVESGALARGFEAQMRARNVSVQAQLSHALTDAEQAPAGSFELQGGSLVLVGCPAGYLLVNSSLAQQRCRLCDERTYSVDFRDGCDPQGPGQTPICGPRECQPCPVGARCSGGHLLPLVNGSEWVEEAAGLSTVSLRLEQCPAGFVLVRHDLFPGLDQCIACPSGSYHTLRAVHGSSLWVERAEASAAQCLECEYGATCAGGSSIVPDAGYSLLPHVRNDRNEPGSVGVLRCPKGACLLGGECSTGRGGVLCSQCLAGYALAGSRCIVCGHLDTEEARIGLLAALAFVLLLLWYLGAWQPFFKREERPDGAPQSSCCWSGAINSWFMWLWLKVQERLKKKRFVDGRAPIRDYAKIVFGYFQIVSNFDTTYSVEWDTSLTQMWQYSSAFRADVFGLPGINCLSSQLSYETILGICVVFPLLFSALLAVPSMVLVVLGETASMRFKQVQDHATRSFLVFLFVVYPFVSFLAVQGFFNCRQVGADNLFVKDMTLPCPSDHKASPIFIWSVVATVLYPVGIPVLVLCVLFWFRIPAMARKKADDALVRAMIAVYKQSTALAAAWARRPGASTGHPPKAIPLASPIDAGSASPLDAAFPHRAAGSGGGSGQSAECAWGAEGSTVAFTGEETTDVLDLRQLRALEDFPFEECLPAGLQGLLASSTRQVQPLPWYNVTVDMSKRANGASSSDADSETAAALDREALLGRVLGIGRDLHSKGLIGLPVLRWDGATEEERDAIDRVGFLFDSYVCEAWWFELAEMARKFVMSALMLYFYRGSPQQVITGLFVTAFFLVFFLNIVPFSSKHLETLQGFSLTAQCVTLLYGLLVSVQSMQHVPVWGREELVVRWVVLMLNVAMFLMPLLLVLPDRARWLSLWHRLTRRQSRRESMTSPATASLSAGEEAEQAGKPDDGLEDAGSAGFLRSPPAAQLRATSDGRGSLSPGPWPTTALLQADSEPAASNVKPPVAESSSVSGSGSGNPLPVATLATAAGVGLVGPVRGSLTASDASRDQPDAEAVATADSKGMEAGSTGRDLPAPCEEPLPAAPPAPELGAAASDSELQGAGAAHAGEGHAGPARAEAASAAAARSKLDSDSELQLQLWQAATHAGAAPVHAQAGEAPRAPGSPGAAAVGTEEVDADWGVAARRPAEVEVAPDRSLGLVQLVRQMYGMCGRPRPPTTATVTARPGPTPAAPGPGGPGSSLPVVDLSARHGGGVLWRPTQRGVGHSGAASESAAADSHWPGPDPGQFGPAPASASDSPFTVA